METIERYLAPFALPAGTKVVVAVSGGVDSMVLMHLLAPLQGHALQLTVAHFDHQLRPESAQEQKLVADAAAALHLPFQTGTWPAAQHPQSGLEAAARQARYAFLTQVAQNVGAQVLMTAHHGDDQVETVLFRLARTGHLPALVGIKPDSQRGPVRVVRPLLTVPKAALLSYAQRHGIPYAEDASNQDLRYSRNLIRHQVTPALKQVNPNLVAHTARMTQALATTEALAQRQVASMLPAPGDTVDWRQFLTETQAVQTILLEAALARWHMVLTPRVARQVLAALAANGSRRFDYGQGLQLEAAYHELRRVATGPVPRAVLLEAAEQWYQVGSLKLGRFAALPAHAQALAALPAGPVLIRTRQAGDELKLANGQHQLLRRYFINQKMPQSQRQTALVAAQNHRVYWVEGIDRGQLFQGSQTDILQTVLALQIE